MDVASADEIPKVVDAINGVEMDGRKIRASRSLEKDQIRSTKREGKLIFMFQSEYEVYSVYLQMKSGLTSYLNLKKLKDPRNCTLAISRIHVQKSIFPSISRSSER